MRLIYKSFPLLLLLSLMGCDNQFGSFFRPDDGNDENGGNGGQCEIDITPVSFKKVAYWSPGEESVQGDLSLINFNALTHIIYTSINVNSDGNLEPLSDDDMDILKELVERAQNVEVKAAVSLGDGSDTHFNTIANSSELTENFVSEVEDFIDTYHLDGIEINWQTIGDDDESDNLKTLLDALQHSLRAEGKFLSIAVPSGENESAKYINNNIFQYVDFVNVMALDSTDSDDLHSSMEDAAESVTYWTDRCLIKNKLVLGVPFYSRGSAIQSYDYLIRDDIRYACVDKSENRNYNGLPTIIDKTNYAILYAGGITMKSLEQDFYPRDADHNDYPFITDDYSLLNAINQTSLGINVNVCD